MAMTIREAFEKGTETFNEIHSRPYSEPPIARATV